MLTFLNTQWLGKKVLATYTIFVGKSSKRDVPGDSDMH